MTGRALRWCAQLMSVVVLAASVVVAAPAPAAQAADPKDWNPGMIISDEVFYASGTMNVEQVQAFLAEKGSRCVPSSTGVVCLKDYVESTQDRPANEQCAAYVGAQNESAAQIIVKSARACGVNPQALIVILQKEQGLVTLSGESLTESRYRSAMGFRCPTGGECEPEYAGFANQVYSAAWRFQYYADHPQRFRFQVGQLNAIAYHPNAACGSSDVFIVNQATAGLYNYTPYQPNEAALAAGYGTGDACSAYGNRNFWARFRDWFGPTEGAVYNPFGELEAVQVDVGGDVRLSGWAIDPDRTGPIYVWVTVNGVGRHYLANQPREDIGAAHPAFGPNHGFSGSMRLDPGSYTVCATASNVGIGDHTELGCKSVTVRGGSPFGNFEHMAITPDGIEIKGWAIDPDRASPIFLWVTVDGVGRHVYASQTRSDVGRAFPEYGPQHGFRATIPATPGPHKVCVTASNVGAGAHRSLGCRGSTPSADGDRRPYGNFELAAGGPLGIEIKGWAIDPDTTAPIYLWVTIDGKNGRHIRADKTRSDVGRVFPGYGDLHGFRTTLAVAPGSHRVCVTASNVGPGEHRSLGCREVTGSGGTLTDVQFRSFTASNGMTGEYHLYAADIDTRRSVGLMIQFHGDGAYEFRNPDSTYSLGGPTGLRAEAAKRNMVLLVAKAPDTEGSVTWWESGVANADYARELIQSMALDRYDVDLKRVWLVGYSGGAQFITRFLLPKYSAMFEGGGAVVFGGGARPFITVTPYQAGFVSRFPMHWYTGALDDGTCEGHRYNALRDANGGSTWYAAQGFATSLETPEGVCHMMPGRFGPVTAERMDLAAARS